MSTPALPRVTLQGHGQFDETCWHSILISLQVRLSLQGSEELTLLQLPLLATRKLGLMAVEDFRMRLEFHRGKLLP